VYFTCVCRATTWATTLTAKTRTRQLQRVSISCHNAAAVCQSVRLTQDLTPRFASVRLSMGPRPQSQLYFQTQTQTQVQSATTGSMGQGLFVTLERPETRTMNA
ncbi:hypothetical protein M5D96_009194, partial [Drosophila gunungcola]